jgi:hypothetical protein
LEFEEESLTGDFNNDSVVDAADYVLWRKNVGSQPAYELWRAKFGEFVSPAAEMLPSNSTNDAPEPVTYVWLSGMAPLFRRWRNY